MPKYTPTITAIAIQYSPLATSNQPFTRGNIRLISYTESCNTRKQPSSYLPAISLHISLKYVIQDNSSGETTKLVLVMDWYVQTIAYCNYRYTILFL